MSGGMRAARTLGDSPRVQCAMTHERAFGSMTKSPGSAIPVRKPNPTHLKLPDRDHSHHRITMFIGESKSETDRDVIMF